MLEIRFVEDNEEKRRITKAVLNDLPEWFGIEEATRDYIDKVALYPFVAAYIEDKAVGFYSIREENTNVLDMYVLGILKKYHHQGLGTKLQTYVNEYAKNKNYKYLMVLTLAEKANDKAYLQTRKFYLAQGFMDFYQNDEIFDKFNPCQIMLKRLNQT